MVGITIKLSDFPKLPEEFRIFGPNNNASHHRNTTDCIFNNLKGYAFTVSQKEFFANQCCEEIFDDDNYLNIRFDESINKFAYRYGLPPSTVKSWKSNYLDPQKINYDRTGAPNYLDEIGLRDLHQEVAGGKKVKGKGNGRLRVLFTQPEFDACAMMNHNKTLKRAGKDAFEDDTVTLDPKTRKKLKKVCQDFLAIFIYS